MATGIFKNRPYPEFWVALHFFPVLWIQGGSEEWEPEPEYTIPHASSRSWFERMVASNLGGAFRPPASITQRKIEIMPFKMLSKIPLKKPLMMP